MSSKIRIILYTLGLAIVFLLVIFLQTDWMNRLYLRMKLRQQKEKLNSLEAKKKTLESQLKEQEKLNIAYDEKTKEIRNKIMKIDHEIKKYNDSLLDIASKLGY